MTTARPLRIGIDLGGTKTELAVIDSHHQVLWRKRLPSARLPVQAFEASPEQLLKAYQDSIHIIACLLSDAEVALPAVRGLPLGLGTPGSESASGSLRNCNSVWLNGRHLRQDLEQQLQRPVRLANDANCFALAEAHMGAAQGASSVFGVILGTGVGGGLVINGQLHAGVNHIAGEWGHNRLPRALPAGERGPQEIDEADALLPCYCGRNNCIETFLSGPGLSASYQRQSGRMHGAEYVLQLVDTGDSTARAVWQQYVQQLARSLAQVINVVDPACIVLGGGLSNVARLYREVPQYWAPYIFSDEIATRLLPAQCGDSAGVFGAAWLW